MSEASDGVTFRTQGREVHWVLEPELAAVLLQWFVQNAGLAEDGPLPALDKDLSKGGQ
jgi:hypothetical protein